MNHTTIIELALHRGRSGGDYERAFTSKVEEFALNFSLYSAVFAKLETRKLLELRRFLDIGREVRQGTRSWKQYDLEEVLRWKLLHPLLPRIGAAALDVDERLKHVFEMQDEEDMIEPLCQIQGIGPALASTLLTLTFPEKFAPLDCHAWNALAHLDFELQRRPNSGGGFTIPKFALYLRIVRKLAKGTNSTPWETANALYASDKVRTRKKWRQQFDAIYSACRSPVSRGNCQFMG